MTEDVRYQMLVDWLAQELPALFAGQGWGEVPSASLSPASSDASFRRYFRWQAGERTFIVMDAPPPQEDCRPFMRMAELLLDKDGKQRWEDYAKSDFDKTKLTGTATEEGKRRYAVNAALYNRWKLKGTPFFAYRSKAGAIKVLNELPKDWDKLVDDIAPAQQVTLPQ